MLFRSPSINEHSRHDNKKEKVKRKRDKYEKNLDDTKNETNVRIFGLNYDTTKERVEKVFGKCGQIISIEFPTFEGAEAWINAEMEPPYGKYGSLNYYLARRIEHMEVHSVIKESEQHSVINENDLDHTNLEEDKNSVVVITFEISVPGSDLVNLDEGQRQKYIKNIYSVSKQHELIRLEAYQLITPQSNWRTTVIT